MSNGGFGGIHQKLLDGLAKRLRPQSKSPVALALTGPTFFSLSPMGRGLVRGTGGSILLFVLRQLAQILENQTRGLWRLIPFFLFLRVADQ